MKMRISKFFSSAVLFSVTLIRGRRYLSVRAEGNDDISIISSVSPPKFGFAQCEVAYRCSRCG
jgi:hypothetical protein